MNKLYIKRNFTEEFYNMNVAEFEILESISMDTTKLKVRTREIVKTRKFFKKLANGIVPEYDYSLYRYSLKNFKPESFGSLEIHFLTIEFIYLLAMLKAIDAPRKWVLRDNFQSVLEENIRRYDTFDRYSDIWKAIYRNVSKM
jgi:hypothetical protein